MSTELEQLQKKKVDLTAELRSLQERKKILAANACILEEKLAVQELEKKVKAERAVVEQLESKIRDLEKRLREPQKKEPMGFQEKADPNVNQRHKQPEHPYVQR